MVERCQSIVHRCRGINVQGAAARKIPHAIAATETFMPRKHLAGSTRETKISLTVATAIQPRSQESTGERQTRTEDTAIPRVMFHSTLAPTDRERLGVAFENSQGRSPRGSRAGHWERQHERGTAIQKGRGLVTPIADCHDRRTVRFAAAVVESREATERPPGNR